MALTNFQLGLNDKLQTIVRSRAPATLADAIAQRQPNQSRDDTRNMQCHKYGKTRHIGRECRTSYANRYNLLKPDDYSRVNATDKFCVHCKKSGHVRDECWKL